VKVLIVDDEPLVLRSLEKAFRAKGHEVAVAVDGNAGLKLWQEFSPETVLLDVLMPGLSGPQVLEKIGRTKSKVILMSAFAGEYDLETAQGLGADHFISKPFKDIFEVVREVEQLFS
jgi:two-component system, response regulator PdtaR